MLLALGMVVVRKDGCSASRLRVFSRSLVAWSPLLVGLALLFFVFMPTITPSTLLILLSVVAVGLAVLSLVSVVLPDRGLADRMAGTRLVPR